MLTLSANRNQPFSFDSGRSLWTFTLFPMFHFYLSVLQAHYLVLFCSFWFKVGTHCMLKITP